MIPNQGGRRVTAICNLRMVHQESHCPVEKALQLPAAARCARMLRALRLQMS